MADFYIRECRTGDVFKVYSVLREYDKTFFLVWKGYWKWLDARKTELVTDNFIGG